ncbi:S8 family serine peptidase [Cellulomonas gilvus]|uniref:Peptidase S8 and S53 subtilisin kexin sedolisin n=1 Tax=Cellulomonas gilvus (strain ATCC 13127 / NRRL B-14078) TaxID=593907 RepID=F8A4N9_CELGA|nr:S8 family serine peptidase [Cellulomonas gilvus]AEI10855.1 peptidase S8 and S53 subtilisin kexin sedolisin [Cellulomonas gilvus ATCC 13127]
MPRRPVLASVTAVSVALSSALLATAASAAPPGLTPSAHDLDTATASRTLAEARKTVGIAGATGQITALVELAAEPAVDVDGSASAVRKAVAATEALAEDVVPAEATDATAGSATPKRLGTLTNLVAGTLVSGDADKIRALASSDKVTAIYRVATKRPMNANTVEFTRALQTWQDTGETGEGISIAVIDTGLDYTHASFGGAGTEAAYEAAYGEDGTQPVPAGSFDSAKYAGGYDFAGPLYDASGDEPGSVLTPTPDENPIDSLSTSPNSGHGTHVAGTAAGYGVDASGHTFTGDYQSLTDLDGWKVGPGSAPGATLWAFKVFGDIGGSTDVTGLALDRAADPNGDGDFSDHVDVVNMSLGSDGAPADDPDTVLVDKLTKLGVVVVNSAGNAGDIVDIGGAPGNAKSALTVANSVAAPVLDSAVVTAAADDSLEGDTFAGQNSVSYSGGADVTAPVAYVGATFDGCEAFTTEQAALVAGKIAYLWWDDTSARRCGSALRFNNATAAGAVGVLLPTEEPVFSAGIAGNAAIPGFQLTKDATDALLPEIQAGTLSVKIGPSLAMTGSLTGAGDLLNDGSSRGNHGSLGSVKPDVAAPGTGILSAASGGGAAGHVLSGTSMASPHVAGIAALVRASHPAWSASEVKAAVVNTATHDVTTEPGGAGLAFGPERVGSGRVDARAAVATDVIAFNSQEPELTSVSFGIVDVGAQTVTKNATITVQNDGTTDRTYDASFVAASTAGGATVTVSPSQVTVPAGGKAATLTLTLTADPATLERELDPTSAALQSGLPREYVAMLTGRVVLESTSDDQELRVPVQAAPRLASDLTAKDVTFTGTATTAGLALDGRGVDDGGWTSLTSPLILGATSPQLEDDPTLRTAPSAIRSGDIRYVGWSSSAPYAEELGADPAEYGTLNIGVAMQGEWATLGASVTPIIDIDIDGDGEPDLQSYVWKIDPSVDLTVVQTYDLHAPASDPAIDTQVINNELGDVDTGVFDNNVFVAPIGLGAVGIEPGDTPTVQVWTASVYGRNGQVDAAKPFTVDPWAPPFWFEVDRPSLISSNGADDTTIPVHRSAKATSGELLVLQHHNAGPTTRTQVVDVSVPVTTSTKLAVSGGTSVGQKATLTATVTPSAAGSVKFSDNGTVVATVPVSAGKAVAKVAFSVGAHKLKATFVPSSGAALGSTSPVVQLTVTKSKTTTKLALSATTVKKGQTVKATVTVTGATSAPSGKVTIKDGGKVIGTGTLSVSGLTGKVTVTLPKTLAVGKHTLTASYAATGKTMSSSATAKLTVR